MISALSGWLLYFAKLCAIRQLSPDVVLHMPKEALLWSIVPAAPLAGHGLTQFPVIKNVDKAVAGIMTALVTVKDRFGMQGDPMLCDQLLHGFQYKVHFQRFTEHIREDLFRERIQDRR